MLSQSTSPDAVGAALNAAEAAYDELFELFSHRDADEAAWRSAGLSGPPAAPRDECDE